MDWVSKMYDDEELSIDIEDELDESIDHNTPYSEVRKRKPFVVPVKGESELSLIFHCPDIASTLSYRTLPRRSGPRWGGHTACYREAGLHWRLSSSKHSQLSSRRRCR